MRTSRTKGRLKPLAKLGLSGILFITMFWNQPIYKRYELDGKGHLHDLKIIFLSDLHNSIYGKNQSKLLKMIYDEQPDLILFGGDIADEKTSLTGTKLLLEGLEGRYPMAYISGNHERWMNNTEEVYDLFQEAGVSLLLDDTATFSIKGQTISLVGLMDPDATLYKSSRQSLIDSLNLISQSLDLEALPGYKILLSHRPEHMALYKKHNFDLVLSGHAHGGQGRIPGLLNGLYAPNQGFFPTYAGGRYDLSPQMTALVSRGLSLRLKLPRVFNPPEVVVITFTA